MTDPDARITPDLPAPPARPVLARDTGRLVIACADRPGIVAAVSTFLAAAGANIIELGQYSTDPEDGRFFQRTVFHLEGLAGIRDDLAERFEQEVAQPFVMDWRMTDASQPKRVAVMVSRYDHCMIDLLWRSRRGELPIDVAMVISNHDDLAADVRAFGVPFVRVPVTAETKAAAEERQLELLVGNVDLVVLARYMQILSGDFLERLGAPVINIHHSFLPAFVGANPYVRAKERGVKLIGATAHYATEVLDDGPIIEQDVVRVSHHDSAEELERRGADVERMVLARAVQWHCDDRVVRHRNSTVIL